MILINMNRILKKYKHKKKPIKSKRTLYHEWNSKRLKRKYGCVPPRLMVDEKFNGVLPKRTNIEIGKVGWETKPNDNLVNEKRKIDIKKYILK